MISISTGGGGGPGGGGKRGSISVFSAESRYRLFRLLHSLEFTTVTFCTLTYPAEFPQESQIYKAHLKEYRRRLERKFGKVRGVWRLEFQKRGAPHFHIMYLDCPFIPLSEWCALWSDVIHTQDENHRKIGVDVKLVTGNTEGALVASYLAKYVAKVDDRDTSETEMKVGRWWGKWNIKEELPIEAAIYDYEAARLVELLLSERKANKWAPLDPSICTVFGEKMGSVAFSHKVISVLGGVSARMRAGGKREKRRRKCNGL